MTTHATATGGAVTEFRLAGVDVVMAGSRAGDPGQQSYKLTLTGPGGEILMFDFGSYIPEIIATKQGPQFWSIECPLADHAPFLAQLHAALHHAVDVRFQEFPNGSVSWQFTGKLL